MEEKLTALLQWTVDAYRNVHPALEQRGDDWAAWYAHWLLTFTDIRDVLEMDPEQSALAKLLRQCDATYAKTPVTASWPQFVAQEIGRLLRRHLSRV